MDSFYLFKVLGNADLKLILELVAYWVSFFVFMGFLLFFHEFGHWVAIKKLGFEIKCFNIGYGKKIINFKNLNIKLILLGASVEMKKEDFEKLNHRELFYIAIAGPVASLIFGLFMEVVSFGFNNKGLQIYANLSYALALINLIPIAPLDGYLIGKSVMSKLNLKVSKAWSLAYYKVGFNSLLAIMIVLGFVRFAASFR